MIWPPLPKAHKKTGAPDTAPRETIQYIGLPSHFLDFKRSNRIFFMFIALSIWKFFYAGFVASHRLHISLEQTMLPPWGIPLLVLMQRYFERRFQFALWIKSGSCLGSIESKLAVNRAFRSSGDLKQNSELDFPPLAVPFLKACSHAAHRPQ